MTEENTILVEQPYLYKYCYWSEIVVVLDDVMNIGVRFSSDVWEYSPFFKGEIWRLRWSLEIN